MEGPLAISRGRRFALAFVATTVIGAIGPWVDLGGQAASGFDVDDGIVTALLAGITFAYVVFSRAVHWAPVVLLGALIAVVGFIDVIDVESVGGFAGLASPGWGLYLTAIPGLGLIASGATAMRGENAGPLDLAGKVIVGLVGIILVAAIITSLTEDDVATVEAPDPIEVEPPE